MSKAYHEFVVRVPALVSKSRMASYIKEAVECWAQGGDPEDPLFGNVRANVRGVPKEKT